MSTSRPGMPMSTLCRFCEDFNLDSAVLPHHKSLGDLQRSAEEGCELCRFILLLLRENNSFDIYPEHSPFRLYVGTESGNNLMTLNACVDRAGSIYLSSLGARGHGIRKSIRFFTTAGKLQFCVQSPKFEQPGKLTRLHR